MFINFKIFIMHLQVSSCRLHKVANSDKIAAICQRCHNRYDVGFRKENRKANKDRI